MADEEFSRSMAGGLVRQARDGLTMANAKERAAHLIEGSERPAYRAMDALDAGRVQATERTLPGLGPTLAERAAQRALDTEQARHFPERREADRTPVVGQPERMSEAQNARLFPTGPSNDDDRGR